MIPKLNANYIVVILIAILFVSAVDAQPRIFPQSPLLLDPPNHSTYQFPGVETPLLFTWDPVINATDYEINVRVDNRPAAQAVTSATSIYLNLHLDVRENRSAVFWSVRAKSGDEFGSLSEIFTFVFGESGSTFPTAIPLPTPTYTPTPTPLPPPRLLSPIDGAAVSILDAFNLEFSWTIVPGAYQYLFTIYRNNEPYRQWTLPYTVRTERIDDPIQYLYQWDVRSINVQGAVGSPGERISFTVGSDVYPTPTPLPYDPDLNQDGKVNFWDIYLVAAIYRTNDPRADLNQFGLINRDNLVRFLELYREVHTK